MNEWVCSPQPVVKAVAGPHSSHYHCLTVHSCGNVPQTSRKWQGVYKVLMYVNAATLSAADIP